MKIAEIKRETNETKIELKLKIDGNGNSKINTGIGFMDHMLDLFAKHGSFDMDLACAGDKYVDFHHSIEDIGIVLGLAFEEALDGKSGIRRFGHAVIPMDEAMILVAVDISGRSFINCDLDIPTEKVGDFDTELAEEFFVSFARNAKLTLHIKQLYGRNSHHIIEGCFKAFARAMSDATSIDEKQIGRIPSTKGII